MKQKTLVQFMVIFFAIILIGCGAESTSDQQKEESNQSTTESSGGELKVAYSAQPPTLDPFITGAIATSDVMRHVFETLITYDSDYEVQPMLAETFEVSDDGKMITFYLREGVLFHNGKEMLAEDVVASMNHFINIPGSRAADHFEGAVFEEEDDYTVVLTLPEPLSTALSVLAHSSSAFPAIVPKEVVEDVGPDGIDEYIGTGPFYFEEWRQDQYIHLKKFDDYQSRDEEADGLAGKREALVDDLYYYIVTDSSTRVAGIQSGEYDVAHAVPFDSAEQLEQDEEVNNHVYPGGFLTTVFNKKKGIFSDVRARQAIAAALDMEDVLHAGYTDEKYYILNNNMMMDHQRQQWDSDAGLELYSNVDHDLAMELLEETGYDGETIVINTTRDYDDQYQGAVVIQEQLEQLGIDVELNVYDWATLLEKNEDEDEYDMFVMGFVAVPEPSSLFFMRESYPGWTDSEELPGLLKKFRGKPSLEEAQDYYDTLLEWYWDYIPIIKIGDFNRVSSTRSTVSDFLYQDGFVFWNIANDK